MLSAPSGRNLLIFSAGVLLLLLLSAGVLTYRWINRASDADRQQQQEFLETAMRSFAGDFSSAIQEMLTIFRLSSRLSDDSGMEPQLVELYRHWQSTAKQPRLIGAVSLAMATPRGVISFRRLQPAAGRFETQAWPASLRPLRDMLNERAQRRGPQPPSPPGPLVLSGNQLAVVLPLTTIASPRAFAPDRFPPPARRTFPPEGGPGPRGFPPPGGPSGPPPRRPPPPYPHRGPGQTPPPQLDGWCLLELDPAFIQNQFLPALVQRHFGGAGLSGYRLAVVTEDASQVLYQSDPGLTLDALASADATTTLFNPPAPFGPGSQWPGRGMEGRSGANAWRLVAKHEAGSIDAVVDRARRRNLAIGFGVLLLLGLSMGLLVLVAERARALAKRQMEFVAGVSHELRTPLAVIQSAGFNLARGVVGDARRVQQYGTTIQTEGRRLSDMIEQMLSFAGIQSGRKHYEFQPTQMSEIIDRSLAEYAAALDEAGWQVERQIEERLPPVLADAQALESALKNLVHNALKYAAEGRWLRLSARLARNGKKPEVEVTVEDRGPGIDPEDVAHIFDPFYRGQKVVASSIPGAGLGLSLLQRHVQAHGGRVTVKTRPGEGTAFTLHLPARSTSENRGSA
jgi:signal transduction histidine kinase